MQRQNLLIELGTEELPPKSLTNLATALADNIQQGLQLAELPFNSIKWYATPRRLAVYITNLADQQQDKQIEKRGPAVSAAFDEQGQPTKAALGWARGNGIAVEQAERLKTDKGEWLVYQATVTGRNLQQLINEILTTAISKLPIPKPMRWGAGQAAFIRPVHNLTVIYGDTLLDAEVLGQPSSTTLFGHRFHGEGNVQLNHADDYLNVLENEYVIADFASRKAKILAGIEAAAAQEGGKADIDEALLDEVTALVEWPVVLTASFDEGFLQVPKEALIHTMKGDQKYFPILNDDGQLLARFIFVTNIESRDPKQIIQGNERVIRPRLADAEFFFETDKKTPLFQRLDSLATVLFQKQLGTLRDKSQRIANLAAHIASQLNADEQQAHRAGLLCKTDLMTDMVMEFPDVQGVMGKYYGLNDGEDQAVAMALEQHYLPRFSGDAVPTSSISCAVALADKLDTLVGIFGIGMLPKGDKDPFALRRAAIGLLRIIVENRQSLDLTSLVARSITLFGDKLTNAQVQDDVVDFVLARFRALYQEQGVPVDVIQAVLACRPTRPTEFAARIEAVQHFSKLPEAQSLAAANKRVGNILSKNAADLSAQWQQSLLAENEEIALGKALSKVKDTAEQAVQSLDYKQALTELAQLEQPVDVFFDNVMVMTDDDAIRKNRLALLNDLHQQFLRIADISLLN